MRIKFSGFQQGTNVTLSALQNGTAVGPVSVSAWQNAAAPGDGTFVLQVQVNGDNGGAFRDVVPGEIIEALGPLAIRCRIQNVSGFATDDKRFLWADVDYGERYTFQSHSDPDIPASLRKLAGSHGGYYPGFVSGHALRGYDMSGNRLLTGTYTGGPGPTGTIDQTVTATVTDGLQTVQVSFTVRLMHSDVYYLDRDKTFAPGTPEPTRDGIIYVSRDGDFTGALPEQDQTATEGAIEHVTIPDGVWTQFSFRKQDLSRFTGNNGFPECISLRFKEGETFDLAYPLSFAWGKNTTLETWHQSSGTAKAIIDGAAAATFDPGSTGGMIKDNSADFTGARFRDIILRPSQFDVSDPARRTWWNILKYSNKSGSFGENTEGNQLDNGWNGELLAGPTGILTQVIQDDGVDTLLVRQIVDISAVASGTDAQKYDDPQAVFATFTDGDTLTGQTSGGTCTFAAAGSRQDRGYKTATKGIDVSNGQGILIDGCEIEGAESGILIGQGSVISDTVVRKCWNYGITNTTGLSDFSESGVIVVQPLGYEGTWRPFAGSVNPNRNAFQTTGDDPRVPTEMAVSHSGRRLSSMRSYSQHYCGGRWFGGHGGDHQPFHRFGTGGSTAEGELQFVMYGCFYQGGANQVQFQTLQNPDSIPYTPDYLIVERCHLLPDFCSGTGQIAINYSNFLVQSNLLETPAIDLLRINAIAAVAGATRTYNADPDVNAVDPVIRFNTIVFRATNANVPDGNYVLPLTNRTYSLLWENNAWAIDTATVNSVDATILSLNDDPGTHYDTLYRPLPTAKAYETATGTIPTQDALGITRPTAGATPAASKGAFEPA